MPACHAGGREFESRPHRQNKRSASRCVFILALRTFRKNITGRPSSDWIESYTAQELIKLLNDSSLTLTQIVDEMHFSSQAMLTRYLKRTLGKTPSEYRKGPKRGI